MLRVDDQAHRLGAGLGVLFEDAAYRRGDRTRAGLLDAAHGHAHVLAIQHRDHPARLEPLHQQVGDLGGEPLLHLRTAGEDVDKSRQLGQPGDPAVVAGDVADVRDAVERQQVMLAEAEDLDVAHQHQLVVVGDEGGGQHLGRLDPQAGEELGIALRDPGRGTPESVPVGVLADRDQDLAYRVLDPLEVDRPLHRSAAEPAVDQTRGEVVQLGVRVQPEIVVRLRRGAVLGRQKLPSELPPERASTPSDSACAFSLSFSVGVSTGGWSDGWRLPKPLYGAIGGRLTTRAAIRAMSVCEMVSFSISSNTISSSTSRYSTRISHASSCASSINERPSESMSAATESE